MTHDPRRLERNLAEVRERMAAAARRAGRLPDEVRLVAVTKYVDAEAARALAAAGCLDLGESRPQELWRKAALLADLPVRWHLIGHLQRNKLARSLPLVSLVHSGDSGRLIEAIDSGAARAQRRVPLLLEVNVSGDASKHGLLPAELEPLVEPLSKLPWVDVRGLMCMAGREGDLDSARGDFEKLRLLRDELRSVWPEPAALVELSMGMSGDFEVAIEEGATLVRIGSSLFSESPMGEE
jgi:PLP dependent protein